MKHPLKPGDRVRALFYQEFIPGTVIKVNAKSVRIRFDAYGGGLSFEKRVDPTRVAHINDIVTVVWNPNRGVEGSYRLDYENYPQHAKPAHAWGQPAYYYVEKLP